MATIRAFIAIEIGETVRAGLERVLRSLRNEPISGSVKWVTADSIHLTLKFLGDVDAARAPQILLAIQTACIGTAPFDLAVRGAGCFPNFDRPNVVWAGLVGDLDALAQLAQRVDDECERMGIPREERPFSPHLTLGRLKKEANQNERKQVGDIVRRLSIAQPGSIRADAVHLIRSDLRPAGTVYTSLGNVKLR